MPRLINIGAVQINAVDNNSEVIMGDNTIGDTFLNEKINRGFGIIFGNANILPANMNCVCDTDVFDQINGSHALNRPNVASPRAHF